MHPFGDGNGRTARLLEFEALLSSGVPAPSSQLLSNHY
ncbi:MAG: Fic family protein, partial [Deltaproteobacteria bacterium]|nr:Fic family protein [Deltaproteobacteria bacterium]